MVAHSLSLASPALARTTLPSAGVIDMMVSSSRGEAILGPCDTRARERERERERERARKSEPQLRADKLPGLVACRHGDPTPPSTPAAAAAPVALSPSRVVMERETRLPRVTPFLRPEGEKGKECLRK